MILNAANVKAETYTSDTFITDTHTIGIDTKDTKTIVNDCVDANHGNIWYEKSS